MMEFLEWASIGNRWLPTLIVIGLVCLTLVELAKIFVKHRRKIAKQKIILLENQIRSMRKDIEKVVGTMEDELKSEKEFLQKLKDE